MVSDAAPLPTAEPTPAQQAEQVQAEELATNVPAAGPETPVEGKEGGDTEEQRIELPEGWATAEPVTKLKSESHAAGYQKAQSELTITHERTLRATEARLEAEKQEAVNAAVSGSVVQQVADAIAKATEGFLDADGLPDEARAERFLVRLLNQNQQWAAAFSGAVKAGGERTGFQQGLYEASKLVYQGLSKEANEALDHFVVTELNVPLTKGRITREDAFTQMLTKRDELVRADERARVEKLVAERLETEAKAKARENGARPVDTAGRGGSGKIPDMTTVKGVVAAKRAGQITEDEAGRRLREIVS